MKLKHTIIFISILIISCTSIKDFDSRWGRETGFCSVLEGKTVVYTVFVDSKSTKNWTGFDIASTKDSLNRVYKWLENQAKQNGKLLNIIPEYHQAGPKQTIKKKLPYDRLSEAFDKDGISDFNKLEKWAESIVKKTERNIKMPKGKKLPAKPRLKGFEKLVAKLKLKHDAQNVAIFLMVNNFYIADASISMQTLGDAENKEFAINSGKNTNILALQLLSLFGAQNLYKGDNNKYSIKNLELAHTDFPNDVMVNADKDISGLIIDDFTAFMIGWKKTIDSKYNDLFKVKLKKKNEKN